MSRAVDEWRGKTDNTAIPARVRLRVFEAYKGKCYRSGRKILAGDKWQLDHIVALINGGEHRESNLAPILDAEHKAKTRDDVSTKSKTARMRAKHLGQWPKSKARIPSRGFQQTRGMK
jgi:5-methylcytosine-specific restriction endonuclease McrA